MFEWLAANLATIIVALVLLAVVVLVIRKMIRDKRPGQGRLLLRRKLRLLRRVQRLPRRARSSEEVNISPFRFPLCKAPA